MKNRQLGKTNLSIPVITFGGNVFGWTVNKKESFKLLDALFERGFNFIDTANVYSRWVDGNSGGESEAIIGEWMKKRGNRDKMIIATKVGMDVGQGSIDLSPEHILDQIDISLKRLQTDYVDIYFSHKDDDSTPVAKTLATYNQLINQGKVRYIGASNFPLARLQESIEYSDQHKLPRYEVYQPEYNLMNRDAFENGFQKFCQKQNISVTSYFTLASGFLTGKYNDKSDTDGKARAGFVSKFFNTRGTKVLDALEQVANEQEVTQAAVAIAWAIEQPGITSPIASASSIDQLKSFDQAVELNLSEDQLELLNNASLKSEEAANI
ncbi:MAG: aldo/keto reductase [Leeuwenhoekiella sp.]